MSVNARRAASIAGTVAVTTIAAIGSYNHMRELALQAGQPPLLAALLPLSVDGMILVATLALGDGRRSKWSAWLAFIVGVSASIVANVIVADPNIVARVVSAWPAVALLLTVEVLARSGRAEARQNLPAEEPEPERGTGQARDGTEPGQQALRINGQPLNGRIVEGETSPSGQRQAGKTRRVRRRVEETRRLAADMLAIPGTTREDVAARLGITPRRLRQVLNGQPVSERTSPGSFS